MATTYVEQSTEKHRFLCLYRKLGRALMCLAVLALVLAPLSVNAQGTDHGMQPRSTQSPKVKRGVLVIAHGGGKSWNDPVREVVRLAAERIPYPVELGFQMMHEDQTVEWAIKRLEEAGANEIVGAPLLISSSGTMFEEIKHLLALPNGILWSCRRITRQ